MTNLPYVEEPPAPPYGTPLSLDDAFVAQVGAAALQAGPAGVGLEPD